MLGKTEGGQAKICGRYADLVGTKKARLQIFSMVLQISSMMHLVKQFYLKCCWNVATENIFMKYSCKTLCLRYCFVEVRVFLLFSKKDVKKSYQFRELFLSLLLLFKLIRSPKINIGRLDAIFSRIATGLSAFNKNTGVMVMLIFLHGKWASNRKVQGSENKYMWIFSATSKGRAWVRTKLSFCLLRSTHLCWRGSRSRRQLMHEPVADTDIKVVMIDAKLDDLEVGE